MKAVSFAKTKPFGYNAFYPGPGLGGHCIPIDPFYLTWKAREFEINTKFIELAGEINTHQPQYVIDKTMHVLNKVKKSLNGSKVLILGAAYKKDIDDMRESPSLKLIELLQENGAKVDYNDPYVPKLPKARKYNYEMSSVDLTEAKLAEYDLVLLSTDHSDYDYKFIAENSKIIVDILWFRIFGGRLELEPQFTRLFQRSGCPANGIIGPVIKSPNTGLGEIQKMLGVIHRDAFRKGRSHPRVRAEF